MKILYLQIKKEHLDKILSREKLKEFREIRPKNAKKYCLFEENGELIGPVLYDAIQFYNGYDPSRPELLIKINESEINLIEDEQGELITYIEDGVEYIESEAVYTLGEIICKKNC